MSLSFRIGRVRLRPGLRLGVAVLLLVAASAIGAGLVWQRAGRAASAPVLGVSGTRLTVDGSPRFLVFVSYFDGVRRARAGRLDEDLRYLAQHVDGIRVLPNWWASTCPIRSGEDTLIDLDGHVRERVWSDVVQLLERASAHGLLVDLSFTRESVTDNGSPARVLSRTDYEAALTQLVGQPRYLKGRFPHVLVDVQNEWTRFASPEQIERLLAKAHEADPARVLAASVSGDAYVPTGRSIDTMVAAYHDPRGPDWFTPAQVTRAIAGVRAAVTQPIYLQEPMPASAICPGQIVDRDMAHFATARDAAQRNGAAAWTFHTRTAFDLTKQLLVEKLALPEGAAEKGAIEAIKTRH